MSWAQQPRQYDFLQPSGDPGNYWIPCSDSKRIQGGVFAKRSQDESFFIPINLAADASDKTKAKAVSEALAKLATYESCACRKGAPCSLHEPVDAVRQEGDYIWGDSKC